MERDKRLLEQLSNHNKQGTYPLHMPGHKRQIEFPNPFSLDITEITGFDNLYHAEGVLKKSMEEAACIYGADQTFYLVNGSSSGILSAVFASVKPGGTLILGRNCHKSAYHAVILNQLNIGYVYPQIIESLGIQGGILPSDVEKSLENHPETEAVLLVSPTYDGIVSDVKGIAQVVHQKGAVLIVDEAHGAHFSFGRGFPVSALQCGADLVIQSLHKTLPALTQAAVLHVGRGFSKKGNLQKYLSMFQTSSPSYVLMASTESCILDMKERGEKWMDSLSQQIFRLRQVAASFLHIRIPGKELVGTSGVYDVDLSKFIISVRGCKYCWGDQTVDFLSGLWLCDWLRKEYHLELELCGADYGLALTSCMDTEEGFSRFLKALTNLDCQLVQWDTPDYPIFWKEERPEVVMDMAEAFHKEGRICSIEDSGDMICGEFIYLYPPGIPIVAPGERITKRIVNQIIGYKRLGLPIQGMEDLKGEVVKVIEE